MTIQSNLTAYYKCDESSGNASDSSGNSYTLTNNGSTPFSSSGKINNCINFGTSNTSKYFNRTTTRIYTGGAFSYSFWVNIQTAPTSGGTQTLLIVNDATTSSYPAFEYENVSGTLKISGGRDRYNVGSDRVVATQTLTIGTWFNIIVTYDGTNIVMYLNNSSSGTTTSTGNGTGAPGNEFRIGSWIANTNYVTAYVDEVGFWDGYVLTSADRAEIYNSGTGRQPPFTNIYTLTCAFASYILTGEAATLNHVRTLILGFGSYTLTGFASTLHRAKVITLGFGSYTLTGFASTLNKYLNIILTHGSYALTGFAIGVNHVKTMVLGFGSYTLTGFSTTLHKVKTMVASFGSYTLTGFSTTYIKVHNIVVNTGYFVLTGFKINLIAPVHSFWTLVVQPTASTIWNKLTQPSTSTSWTKVDRGN